MSIHLSICPSVRSNLNETWQVGRGQRVMHDDILHDSIQGQGHDASKIIISDNFKLYLLHHFQWQL